MIFECNKSSYKGSQSASYICRSAICETIFNFTNSKSTVKRRVPTAYLSTVHQVANWDSGTQFLNILAHAGHAGP